MSGDGSGDGGVGSFLWSGLDWQMWLIHKDNDQRWRTDDENLVVMLCLQLGLMSVMLDYKPEVKLSSARWSLLPLGGEACNFQIPKPGALAH